MLKNAFDSRALGFTDAYGQRFMREGTYRYDLTLAPAGCMSDARPYTIEVVGAPSGHQMRQHTVLVTHDKRRFHPDQRELQIQVGDLVLWSCRQQSAPLFEVVGDHEFFSSAHLTNECGYAHAFGNAGKYHWVDAYGSGLRGVVRVRDPKCQTDKDLINWRRQLANGALVMIKGDKADPAKIEIVTGQTVYFAVVKSDGVSITERSLADASYTNIRAGRPSSRDTE